MSNKTAHIIEKMSHKKLSIDLIQKIKNYASDGTIYRGSLQGAIPRLLGRSQVLGTWGRTPHVKSRKADTESFGFELVAQRRETNTNPSKISAGNSSCPWAHLNLCLPNGILEKPGGGEEWRWKHLDVVR